MSWSGAALASVLGLVAAAAFAEDTGQLERGRQVFTYWCATCHGPGVWEGRPLPGTASLQNKYKGALPAVLEERTDLPSEYVQFVIRRGSEGMPFFRKTEISDEDMQAIGDYLARRNSGQSSQ